MVRPSRFNNSSTNQTHQQSLTNSNLLNGTTTSSAAPAINSASVNPPADNPVPPPPPPPAVASAITGPTSALTSFLKEQGIRPRNVSRFTSIQPQPSSSTAVIEEEATQEDDQAEHDSEVDSDNLDDEPVLKRNAQGKQKKALDVAQSSSSKTKVGAQKKGSSPEPPPKPKPGKYADRKPGFIATCAECGKRFTVTRYTPSAPGQGQLCDQCAQETLAKAGKKEEGPGAPKKRKTRKNQPVKPVWSENSIQTLQMACIAVVASNIESIDALGNVGSVNLEKICQIVCKHRELKPVNLPLFLDVSHSELKLFDCIHLRQDSLFSISTFCPRLERLKLNLCGHMTGEVLVAYAERLTRLRELDLFGPYLVRKEAWLEVFKIWSTPRLVPPVPIDANGVDEMDVDESENKRVELVQGPQIQLFRLKQSPRLDLDCVKALVECCKNLTCLRLDDISLLDDRALDAICLAGLHQLQNLSIANAGIMNGATGESLTDRAVVRLLESVGSTLEVLDISQNKKLTDVVLCEGIGKHCRKLHSLNINGLRELSTKGVQDLFKEFKQANALALHNLNLARCIKVGNDGLFAILDHSAGTLKSLDLNSVDELRTESLERLAKEAVGVEELDVSFVRDVDDFIIKAFLDGMKALKSIYVYGDNRVSDLCPTRRGVMIKGQERAIVVG